MPQALVFRHLSFEDLGSLATPLAAAGYTIEYRDAGVDDFKNPDAVHADLLVVLGGPIGVHEMAEFPFLRDELSVIGRRLQAGQPTLGICLGSQLLAHAMGATVHPDASREVGWGPVELTAAGRVSALQHFAPECTPVFHWHSDLSELPPGATLLARTAACACQAFARDGTALGIQFHPEVTPSRLESWYVGYAHEFRGSSTLSLPKLREDAALYGVRLARQCGQFVTQWLHTLSVRPREHSL